MAIRNPPPLTQSTYVQQVFLFARHFGKYPDLLGPRQMRDYQLFLATDKQLAACLFVVAASALPSSTASRCRRTGTSPRSRPPPGTPQAAGHCQPRGGHPLPRLRHRHQAPRQPVRLRGRQPAPGHHLNRHTAEKACQNARALSGLDKPLTLHSLRDYSELEITNWRCRI